MPHAPEADDRWPSWLALCAVLWAGLISAPVDAQVLPRLPALGLQRDAVTVSGLSSGGYMAGQFEVAYSSAIAGAAVLAAGPYACSRGSVTTAMFACSCPAQGASIPGVFGSFGSVCQVLAPGAYVSFSELATQGNRADIDATSHLASHRIWLFSGGRDHVVDRQLVNAAHIYYQHMGVPEAHTRHKDIADAGHGFPSPQATQACGATHTPFLTQCQFDAAGELFKWLYPDLGTLQPAAVDDTALLPFQQTGYASASTFNGLDSTGWLYVPKACTQPGAQCRLHVVFHGCEQAQSFVAGGQKFGTQFVKGAGYNRWAEAGHIVVLYPQVKPSHTGSLLDAYQYNPKGCWDFWGYTEKFAALNPTAPNFAKRSAPQMAAVKAMIDDLLRSH